MNDIPLKVPYSYLITTNFCISFSESEFITCLEDTHETTDI